MPPIGDLQLWPQPRPDHVPPLMWLLSLESEADTAYVDTAVTACNTGVDFRLPATPEPTIAPAP